MQFANCFFDARATDVMRRALSRVMACVLVLSDVTGCARTAAQTPPLSVPQVSEEQRAQFGTVAVVSIAASPEHGLNSPVIGRAAGAATGALGGAASGAFQGLGAVGQGSGSGLAGGAGAIGILLIPAFVVGGLIVGTIAGAANAIPTETAKSIEQKIELALKNSDPQNAIRRDVIEVAQREGVLNESKLIDAGTLATNDPSGDQRLRALGAATILEVGVMKVGLEGIGGSDPDLDLVVQASVRLMSARTGAVLYENKNLQQIGPRHSYSEWGANDAALLTTQLQSAYRSFASTIVDRVFLEFH